jgi:hypothetical protein
MLRPNPALVGTVLLSVIVMLRMSERAMVFPQAGIWTLVDVRRNRVLGAVRFLDVARELDLVDPAEPDLRRVGEREPHSNVEIGDAQCVPVFLALHVNDWARVERGNVVGDQRVENRAAPDARADALEVGDRPRRVAEIVGLGLDVQRKVPHAVHGADQLAIAAVRERVERPALACHDVRA